MTATSLQSRIAEVVARADLGEASAVKRGRNPRWPYVPVILHGPPGDGSSGYTSQIRGLAFETREEALASAEAHIAAERESLRTKLGERQYRALREQYGLPREIEP